MHLSKAAYQWALAHLRREGDGDIFPRHFEIDAVAACWSDLLPVLLTTQVQDYRWRGGRRVLIPKDALAFRSATQLDPLDSLMITALIGRSAERIEKHRTPDAAKTVYSYRVGKQRNGQLYSVDNGWLSFWQESITRSKVPGITHVLITDITDYYNQVYHHVLENQLDSAKIPGAVAKAIRNYLKCYSDTVSRGVPVGPHTSHLLAELALCPVDDDLKSRGVTYVRYVDDIHVFCRSAEHATELLHVVANIADSQQRLVLNRQKTRVSSALEFQAFANSMLHDRPASEEEDKLLQDIRRITGGNPYRAIALTSLDATDLRALDQANIERLLSHYLSQPVIDYPTFRRIG